MLYKTSLLLLAVLLILSCDQPTGSAQRLDLNTGDAAPDFTLPAYPSQEFNLSAQRDQSIVVLYFYHADNTPDCTKQVCAFRDIHGEFLKHDAVILGVSQDNIAAHELFADEHDIPFPLLYDHDGQIRQTFGEPDGSNLTQRITYVIDKQGIIREIIKLDNLEDFAPHITKALDVVKAIAEKDTK